MLCCICGKEFDEEGAVLLVSGKPSSVCAECADELDIIANEVSTDSDRNHAAESLKKKMTTHGSHYTVVEAVMRIINENIKVTVSDKNDNNCDKKKEQAEESVTDSSNRSIKSFCSYLTTLLKVYRVAGIIISLICGIVMIGNPYTLSAGFGVLIGGILFTVLSFSISMLMISVASAIGEMNNRVANICDHLDLTTKHITRITNILSSQGPTFNKRNNKS